MKFSYIFIHCAMTENGSAYPTIREIDEWHGLRGFRRSRFWRLIIRRAVKVKYCGYNEVIERLGKLSHGRSWREVGAHTRGYNRRAIAFCMTGTDKFDLAQWARLKRLVTKALEINPDAVILGHYHADPIKKAGCPGFNTDDWIAGDMEPLAGHIC